jgi:hypothetical protein
MIDKLQKFKSTHRHPINARSAKNIPEPPMPICWMSGRLIAEARAAQTFLIALALGIGESVFKVHGEKDAPARSHHLRGPVVHNVDDVHVTRAHDIC